MVSGDGGVPLYPTDTHNAAPKHHISSDQAAAIRAFESWETWVEQRPSITMNKDADFPAFTRQKYKQGDSKVPDLLTGDLMPLDPLENGAWIKRNDLVQESPPVTVLPKPLRAIVQTIPEKDLYDPFHPQSPGFNVQDYVNKVTGKYNCPKCR